MLRFSANLSMLFTELELRERFTAARNCGFEAVEVQFPYSLPAPEIAALLQENGLKLVLFNVGAADLLQGGEGLAAVPTKRAQFRQALEQAVEYAAILQPQAVNILPGRCYNQECLNAYRQTFTDNLGLALQAMAALEVKTVFEAINVHDMPGSFVSSGNHMLEILAQAAHPNLFMQYDIYHMLRMGENAAEFIATHADKIGHIQFADCPGRAQPGTGLADFGKLFGVIAHSPYQGWVGAEYIPTTATPESLGWLKRTALRISSS